MVGEYSPPPIVQVQLQRWIRMLGQRSENPNAQSNKRRPDKRRTRRLAREVMMATWTADEQLTFDIAFALKKVTIPGFRKVVDGRG
jgi:hypothetical protein